MSGGATHGARTLRGLESIVPATAFDVPVAGYTTFRIGGPAWAVCRIESALELKGCLAFLRDRDTPFRVIGKGSNLLFPDEGFAGVLITLGEGFSKLELGTDGLFTAGAGLSLPRMANTIARAGLGGLEFSAQIPGSVGGGVAVNAGAFAQELHTRLVSVTGVTKQGEDVFLPASALAGCYRTTALKGHQDLILTAATFRADPQEARFVMKKQREYGSYRERTQPVNMASAGCVFKNPGKAACSAGALIDALGLKGLSVGDARVSEKHANFIVNHGKAEAGHIVELIDRVRARALAERGVVLEPEIEFVGRLRLAA